MQIFCLPASIDKQTLDREGMHTDTYQLFLFHALHKNDEEVLGLRAAVGERLLNGHQQLVSQRFIDDAERNQ